MCLNCYKFRIPKLKLLKFATQFRLLYAGHEDLIKNVDEIFKKVSTTMTGWDNILSSDDNNIEEEPADIGIRLKNEFTTLLKSVNLSFDSKCNGSISHGSSLEVRKKLIREFFMSCQVKCPHCSSFSPRLRRDGYSKIFKTVLSHKMKKVMLKMHYHFKIMY